MIATADLFLRVLACAIAAAGGLIALDLFLCWAARAGMGRRILPLETAVLASLIVLFFLENWIALPRFLRGTPVPTGASLLLRLSVSALYFTCLLIYFQCKSVLSRGYSIRVLVDLLAQGGDSTVDALQAGYGGGLGITGMLAKRLRSMATFHLARFDETQAGPLTPLGHLFAVISATYRRLLRLENVG